MRNYYSNNSLQKRNNAIHKSKIPISKQMARTVTKHCLPQGVPWSTAGTAERPCCRADRAELRSPPPPPPRPAQRLHAAQKYQVKIKYFLSFTFVKTILTLKKDKDLQKIYYLPLGTRALPAAGATGRW
jgi:hypothetical protein